ncbi:unnamed protein product [Cylicocyclus nassatus]|uniref:Uncharacterized protein n=1 Tax=Cylicocyclus nassatus TaxID=53992 RepID=A0AA36M679_CYLNA|nr:unnamed protein product [Cylicocyclus nassatus]
MSILLSAKFANGVPLSTSILRLSKSYYPVCCLNVSQIGECVNADMGTLGDVARLLLHNLPKLNTSCFVLFLSLYYHVVSTIIMFARLSFVLR